MSKNLRPMHNTGSRNITLQVNRYCGGKKGVCYQLTGLMEERQVGYVQLSEKDIYNLYRRVKAYKEGNGQAKVSGSVMNMGNRIGRRDLKKHSRLVQAMKTFGSISEISSISGCSPSIRGL